MEARETKKKSKSTNVRKKGIKTKKCTKDM
jgi:hypothetical protein